MEKVCKKKNRRTLRSRIGRVIFLSSFINTLIFAVILFAIAIVLCKSISMLATNYISSSIAKDLSSESFLRRNGIQNLEQVAQRINGSKELENVRRNKSERARMMHNIDNLAWQNTVDGFLKLKNYVPMGLSFELHAVVQDKESRDKGFQNQGTDEIVFFHIEAYEKVLFSNTDRYSNNIKSTFLKNTLNIFNQDATYSIFDYDGKRIGSVAAKINPYISFAVFLSLIVIIIIMIIISVLLAKLLSTFFSFTLIKPLTQLNNIISDIADENFESIAASQIVLKRPLREIEELADSTNNVMSKMKNYAEQLQNQNYELENQNEELVESRIQVEKVQKQIIQSNRSVRILLNNASQGFLTFSKDMKVEKEYSQECVRIFGTEIAGREFPIILYPDDLEQQSFINRVFCKVFSFDDESTRKMYLQLLPEEITINGKNIHIDYKVLSHEYSKENLSIMVILTDVTDKRYLQSQIERERNTLKMVIKVVTNYNDFAVCIKDYEHFCKNGLDVLLSEGRPVKDILLEVYRNIHSFKGNLSIYGMITLVPKLHQLESELSELCKDPKPERKRLVECMKGLDMMSWLNEDMSVLIDILGRQFFDQDNVLTVDKFKLIEIEKKMVAILSSYECKLLLPDIRQLRYKPFKELLKAYPEGVARLAERSGKQIYPVEVKGGEFLVDFDKYYEFSKSLIHIFRNMLDHGIETPDDRIAMDKDELGLISCSIELVDNFIDIKISDDGYGIDIEKVKIKAVENGIYNKEEIQSLSQEDVVSLIFLPMFSTKDEVSELSGRGVGLAAVKNELDKLGGIIKVKTEKNQGTTFEIKLPYSDTCIIPQLSLPNILKSIAEVTCEIFKDQLGIELSLYNDFETIKNDKLPLKPLASFINIRGIIDGMLIISVDEPLCIQMTRGFIIGSVAENELEAYAEDTLAECSNIIMGNSIKLFAELENLVIMDSPITICTDGASVKYSESEIWTCNMKSIYGDLDVSFVVLNKNL